MSKNSMIRRLLKNKYIKPILFFQLTMSLVIVSLTSLHAQKLNENSHSFKNNWVIDFNLGYSTYFGDASNKGYFQKFFKELSIAGGVTTRKMFTPFFGLGLNLEYARLYSLKDKNSMGQPVSFELIGNYFDFNFHGYIDYGSLFWGYNENRWFTVYSTLGIGMAFWGTTLYDHVTGIAKTSGQTYNGVKYGRVGAVVPIGIGMNFKVAKNWAINVEGNLRTVLSDDVDVWNDGFPVDQPFMTTVGVSYYINYGFRSKKKSGCGCPKTTPAYAKMDPIPLYDYDYTRWSAEQKEEVKEEPVKPSNVKPDTLFIAEEHSTKGIVFRVQILAKRTKLQDLALFKKKYNIKDDIHENYQDGVYRYSIGYFRHYAPALEYSNEIRRKGIFDAFVVVYKDNIRIPLTPEMKKR
jgi:hypothetical protein